MLSSQIEARSPSRKQRLTAKCERGDVLVLFHGRGQAAYPLCALVVGQDRTQRALGRDRLLSPHRARGACSPPEEVGGGGGSQLSSVSHFCRIVHLNRESVLAVISPAQRLHPPMSSLLSIFFSHTPRALNLGS